MTARPRVQIERLPPPPDPVQRFVERAGTALAQDASTQPVTRFLDHERAADPGSISPAVEDDSRGQARDVRAPAGADADGDESEAAAAADRGRGGEATASATPEGKTRQRNPQTAESAHKTVGIQLTVTELELLADERKRLIRAAGRIQGFADQSGIVRRAIRAYLPRPKHAKE